MATLNITVPDAQVPRVQAAFGKSLRLVDGNGDPRDATADEVRQYLVDVLIDVVRRQERVDASDAAVVGVTPIDATL